MSVYANTMYVYTHAYTHTCAHTSHIRVRDATVSYYQEDILISPLYGAFV
jgi:hypothetical protein